MPGLNIPQHQFISSTAKFNAFVGGMGSGKTWVGANAIMKHHCQFPRVNSAYYAPTHKLVKDVFWPTLDEVAGLLDFKVKFKTADKEAHLFRGRAFYGVVHCRTLDKPENIVGFKSGYSLLDELDIMPTKKAQLCWRKVIGRMRYKIDGLRNGVDVTTTPEGFKFVYEKFKLEPEKKPELKKHYRLIHASTYDNEKNLPHDYIDTMVRDYPSNYINAYLNGQFVSLTSGQVYHEYDREKHNSDEVAQPGETIYVGMDFNVQKMACAIFVWRGDEFHCVGQIVNGFDTPGVIDTLIDFWGGRKIVIYPDVSGGSRSTLRASISDIDLLRQAGFSIKARSTNPAVRDRVLAVNSAFMKGKLKVNHRLAPDVALCLEQQTYDHNGEPDKSAGKDHSNDAFGYPVAYEMPVVRQVSNIRVSFPT